MAPEFVKGSIFQKLAIMLIFRMRWNTNSIYIWFAPKEKSDCPFCRWFYVSCRTLASLHLVWNGELYWGLKCDGRLPDCFHLLWWFRLKFRLQLHEEFTVVLVRSFLMDKTGHPNFCLCLLLYLMCAWLFLRLLFFELNGPGWFLSASSTSVVIL